MSSCLVGLVLHQLQRLGAGQLETLHAVVLLDDLLHFLLDGGQEFGREGLVHVEVIVEAVFDGRADGQLGLGLADA